MNGRGDSQQTARLLFWTETGKADPAQHTNSPVAGGISILSRAAASHLNLLPASLLAVNDLFCYQIKRQ